MFCALLTVVGQNILAKLCQNACIFNGGDMRHVLVIVKVRPIGIMPLF